LVVEAEAVQVQLALVTVVQEQQQVAVEQDYHLLSPALLLLMQVEVVQVVEVYLQQEPVVLVVGALDK
jgi:hypothetical protein